LKPKEKETESEKTHFKLKKKTRGKYVIAGKEAL
jgi:hypothetical protein